LYVGLINQTGIFGVFASKFVSEEASLTSVLQWLL
jgi:hypothetical protein